VKLPITLGVRRIRGVEQGTCVDRSAKAGCTDETSVDFGISGLATRISSLVVILSCQAPPTVSTLSSEWLGVLWCGFSCTHLCFAWALASVSVSEQ
jgi:hypothetical protein